jgi:hypothetical protein
LKGTDCYNLVNSMMYSVVYVICCYDSVATLTKVLARASGETQAESVLHDVASWWLLICGIIYTAAVS